MRWKPLIGLLLLGGLVILLSGEQSILAGPYASNVVAVTSMSTPAPPMKATVPPMSIAAAPASIRKCAAPCQHGGMCVSQQCRCPPGYEGSACQTRLPTPAAECGPSGGEHGSDNGDSSRCKPSFLIIGAGKSGTSSLYYYLVAHPAVHQAVQKQLQFFDHGYPTGRVSGKVLNAAMETYFSKGFPAKMPDGHITGEASPGYMVYSEVPQRIKSQLPTVRILAVVRDPVTRAFSSYKYNYLRNLPPGALPIPFGVMVRWEIDRVINPCLAKHGYREGGRLPMIDITRDCYDGYPLKVQYKEVYDRSNPTYTELQLPRRQRFVYKGMVGRGLYALMMQHYYNSFSPHQIRLVCTEALSTPASAAAQMRGIGEWLGLRPGLDEPGHYDFTEAVAVGKYNTGDNTGYETTTPWGTNAGSGEGGEEVEPGHVEQKASRLGHNAKFIALAKIDEGSERVLRGFYKPFNDQLFAMAHRDKCEDWLSNKIL